MTSIVKNIASRVKMASKQSSPTFLMVAISNPRLINTRGGYVWGEERYCFRVGCGGQAILYHLYLRDIK